MRRIVRRARMQFAQCVGATASVLIVRLVPMPEAYWAAIATLVVTQSTLGATLTLSLEWIFATAPTLSTTT